MVERKRRKKNKVRGERTHGQGDTKNNRGAGCRGGRGRAGSNKGKFASLGRLDKKKYKLKPKQKEEIISLKKINDLIENNKIKKEKEYFVIDNNINFGKIVSQGEAKYTLLVKIKATKKTVEKILKAGGKIDSLEEMVFEGE